MEIGYSICKAYRNQGLATEVLRKMACFAARLFNINALYGRVMKGNAASVKVMEKNGFHFLREEAGAEDDPYGQGMLVFQKHI